MMYWLVQLLFFVLLPAKFVVLCMKNFSESSPNQLLTLLLALYFHSIFFWVGVEVLYCCYSIS